MRRRATSNADRDDGASKGGRIVVRIPRADDVQGRATQNRPVPSRASNAEVTYLGQHIATRKPNSSDKGEPVVLALKPPSTRQESQHTSADAWRQISELQLQKSRSSKGPRSSSLVLSGREGCGDSGSWSRLGGVRGSFVDGLHSSSPATPTHRAETLTHHPAQKYWPRDTALSDSVAEWLLSPGFITSESVPSVLHHVQQRLLEVVATVGWNAAPRVRAEWKNDMRFVTEWWLSLRHHAASNTRPWSASSKNLGTVADGSESRSTRGRPHLVTFQTTPKSDPRSHTRRRGHSPGTRSDIDVTDHYPPLIVFEQKGQSTASGGPGDPSGDGTTAHTLQGPEAPQSLCLADVENEFISDVALKMRTSAPLDFFHMDYLDLGSDPVRVCVLLFDGIARATAQSSLLRGISFAFCNLRSASLLVLLAGLSHCAPFHNQIEILSLAYNSISNASLTIFAALLPLTPVTTLSLRGNSLSGPDAASFRDFLLDGCVKVVELDLSYTSLQRTELQVLVDSLPSLSSVCVLLLDGVAIPPSLGSAFVKAIEHSALVFVSFSASPVALSHAQLLRIRRACWVHQMQRARHLDRDSQAAFPNLPGAALVDPTAARSGACTHADQPAGAPVGLPDDVKHNFSDGIVTIADNTASTSFFEHFKWGISSSSLVVWRRRLGGVPPGYGAFTTNDPSLQCKPLVVQKLDEKTHRRRMEAMRMAVELEHEKPEPPAYRPSGLPWIKSSHVT